MDDEEDDEDIDPDEDITIAELSATSTTRTEMTLEDRAGMLQEHWEDLAWHADYARGRNFARLEALETVLPHLPDGPDALLLERALLKSEDLQATLRTVEQAARAIAQGLARAWELSRSDR